MNRAAPSPEVLRRAFEVFDRMRVEPAGQRDRLLDSDETLSDEVRSAVRELLAHDSPTGEFLGVSVGAASAQLLEPLAEALTPTSIGRYRVVRELGRGGFGRVYLAEQDRPRRPVAVKVLRAGSSVLEARRLLFEAEALARLDHPAIARVYECGSVSPEDPSPFIAMEYVEGVTLDRRARELAFAERCELLARVCDGIDHAHRRGVLHRDLAPKNILVDAAAGPRIIDFGLASMARSDHATQAMTLAGTVLGTLRFMSPEQLSGQSRSMDTRSDVFSLGVIVFETLTGVHPFLSGEEEIAPALRAMLEAPVRRSTLAAFRGDAEAVLIKCVERDPGRRYASAADLARDLRALAAGRAVAARSYTMLQRLSALAVRRKKSVLAAGAIAALLVTAGTGSVLSLRRAAIAHDAAMNALDAVVTHVIAPLAPRVGTLEDRERLLESIGPDVDRISWRAEEDARAARIVGAYFAARGDVQLDRLQYRAALPHYERAVAFYETAMRLGDGAIDTAHAASMVIVKLGDTRSRVGGDWRAMHVRALEIDAQLAARHPRDVRLLSNLFWSHWRLAGSTLDQPSGDHVERAAQVAEAMMRVDATNWRTLEARARVLTRRGVEAVIAGRGADALADLEGATAAARTLLATDPGNIVFLKTFIKASVAYAGAALDARQDRIAEASLSEAQAAIAALQPATLDSDDRNKYVESVHEPLARLALQRGAWANALHHAEHVIAALREQHPIDHIGSQLAVVQLRALAARATALRAAGRLEDAARAQAQIGPECEAAKRNAAVSDLFIRWVDGFAAAHQQFAPGDEP